MAPRGSCRSNLPKKEAPLMSSTGQELHELLGLQWNVVETISYSEFLTRLRDRPEMADSAAARLAAAKCSGAYITD